MLLPLFWGTLLSGLTIANLFWWTIPLYDVDSATDQPISKLRGLAGQTLLIITVMTCSSFVQITITGVLWRRWINTNTKLHSRIIFPIISGMNPILWSWKFINIEIITIALFGLILHLTIGFLQTQITVKYHSKLYNQPASWLPPTLRPFTGNLSSPFLSQELSAIMSPITRNDGNADETIGSIAASSIGYANITQHTNDTLHFYVSIPKLNAKVGQIAYYTNSTYSIINQTHVTATINGDDGVFCIITFHRSVDIGTWIGCDRDQYSYVFYDQTRYYNNSINVLDINNNSVIRYELVQQCYHVWRLMNGTEYSRAQTGCDQAYVSATLGFENVLELLLYNLNSIQYLDVQINNPLILLMYLKTVGSDMDFEIQNNLATAIFTFCTWAFAYDIYEDTGSYIYPYILQYFTSGDMSNKWFIIIVVPALVTLITIYNLRKVNIKMSKKLNNQYWLIESVMEHGEWKAISKDDEILLENEQL